MGQFFGDNPCTTIYPVPEKMSVQFQVDMLEGICYARMPLTCFQWRSLKNLALWLGHAFVNDCTDIGTGRIFWQHLNFYSIKELAVDMEVFSICNVKI